MPRYSSARLATTSLVFMLTEVPAPPWKTSIGNWSMHRPSSRIWSQAQMIASALSPGRVCRRRLAIAAAFFTMTMPRINAGMELMVT